MTAPAALASAALAPATAASATAASAALASAALASATAVSAKSPQVVLRDAAAIGAARRLRFLWLHNVSRTGLSTPVPTEVTPRPRSLHKTPLPAVYPPHPSLSADYLPSLSAQVLDVRIKRRASNPDQVRLTPRPDPARPPRPRPQPQP